MRPDTNEPMVFPREEAHALSMMVAAASALDSAALAIKNADIKNKFRQFETDVRKMIAQAATGVGE